MPTKKKIADTAHAIFLERYGPESLFSQVIETDAEFRSNKEIWSILRHDPGTPEYADAVKEKKSQMKKIRTGLDGMGPVKPAVFAME